MPDIFIVNSQLPLGKVGVCHIDEFLGGGGQGEVYRVNVNGRTMALKWYYPGKATKNQWLILDTLIKKGRPDERYLWPMELVTSAGIHGFGYLMPLRDPEFRSIVSWMKRDITPGFRALATVCYELADSFLQLHSMGYCYGDISFNNVFFSPDTGDILICDNDNVTVEGSGLANVKGTVNFMAPEIVRNEAGPSINTDLYSLSVLMFYILFINHPLYGRKLMSADYLSETVVEELCGYKPLFIFNSSDRSNEAVPLSEDSIGEAGGNALIYWQIYPEFIKELFLTAFTEGIRDPNARVREGVWRAVMLRLRDSIFYCSSCGAENFYDRDRMRMSGGSPGKCWACNESQVLPPRLKLDDDIVLLNDSTQLYPHHIDESRPYDFSRPVAQVVSSPRNPKLKGLKNLSGRDWTITLKDGTELKVESERSFALLDGVLVSFGGRSGEVKNE